MILDRSASVCADFARRDHNINCSRSASVTTNSAFGRPVRGITHTTYLPNSWRRTPVVPLIDRNAFLAAVIGHRPTAGTAATIVLDLLDGDARRTTDGGT
jgi:hypothetical protein